ncbi:MAG TPA: methionyl-tRNA formyltransferase [Saprospiraceae bacterium]|nr:methionyl-tRNA formyltransferase [Saprospiraceae bacterium]
MRIVFMGTPEFAVHSLDILFQNGFDIAAVITVPDKLGGRGMKQIMESPVKQYALEKNLKILQPLKLKDPAFLEELKSLNADLQVVVAFRMLPELVWSMPLYGTINLHGSLLPKYRGAAPINWAIINGESKTGVTTFFLTHEIDTGDILLNKEIPIEFDDTAGTLHDKMKIVGAELVLKTVKGIKNKTITAKPQIGQASSAPKLNHEVCKINWNDQNENDTHAVYNFIRGLSPFPGAWTIFEGQQIKILKAAIYNSQDDLVKNKEGTYIIKDRKKLIYFTRDGGIDCLEVQLEGKRKMNAIDFINGLKT